MDKKTLHNTVDTLSPILIDLSDKIWEFAELSMQEFSSANYYITLLKKYGFSVEENLCGIQTAFLGRFGEGKPVIGILGEYDALSNLSQQPNLPVKTPVSKDGCGHGCGHNLLGAASLGAALAIKEQIVSGNLQGTIVFYGCPGEEGCAGKTFMARDGMFRDLDAALCWHPSDVNEVITGSNAASLQLEYTFTGISSHAADSPEQGRSALDCAELMNIGVQFLREHMDKSCSVHYSYLDAGGISPNVVQPTAKLLYMVRGDSVKSAKALLKRVNKIAEGAALMTEASVSSRQIDGTASTLSNTVLEKLLFDNMQQTPLPVYTDEETTFAKALKETYNVSKLPGHCTNDDPSLKKFVTEHTKNGEKPLNDFLLPYTPSIKLNPGSTDVGDVSWLTPTAQFHAVTWPSGAPAHTWQIVSVGKSSIAHKGMIYAAKVMAGTVADLMTQPKYLTEACNEFHIMAHEGYDCPISNDVKPI